MSCLVEATVRHPRLAAAAAAVLLAACGSGGDGGGSGSDGPSSAEAPIVHAAGDPTAGREVFRFETFGNEPTPRCSTRPT